MTTWRVEDNGERPRKRGDVKVLVDGEDVSSSVVSFTVRHRAREMAQLELTVRPLVQVTVIGETEPRWHGLEDLPPAALRAELARRDAFDDGGIGRHPHDDWGDS